MKKKLLFPLLAQAVEEFDRTAPRRQKLWDRAATDADVAKAQAADERARLKLCAAFWKEPANPNSRFNTYLLQPSDARRFAKLTK